MDPFKYINSFPLFGTETGYKPGLKRIKRLLYYLGNPEQDLNIIHIAGTNGKGSTASILEAIYREAGYKTGLYSSPHFFHFNERIKINGRACSTYQLTEIIKDLKSAAAKMKKENYFEPSFFELVTAVAFKYFKQHQAEIVILETGLGGRLDATNVISSPLLSIVTNISLEHSQLLGNSAAEIAAEKAGIIKADSGVITAVTQPEALKVIKDRAETKNAKFINLKQEYEIIKGSSSLDQNIITLKRKGRARENYQLSLLGKHQAENAALALRTVEELNQKLPTNKKQIKRALKNVYCPARMQRISSKPMIILDAAHNPAAFKELLKNISDSDSDFKDLHLLFSVLKDKDLNAILEEFSAALLKPKFYIAENSSFRTIKIDKLEESIKNKEFEYEVFDSLAEAGQSALRNADKADLILAAGSFNTVFEAGIEFMSKGIRGGENE